MYVTVPAAPLRQSSTLEALRADLLSAGARANLRRAPVALQDQILFALAAVAQARRGDIAEEVAEEKARAALNAWDEYVLSNGE